MANPSAAHEPSMEEILASIRQIISEDGEGSAASPLGNAPTAPNAEAAAAEPAAPTREPYETVVSRLESEAAPEPIAARPAPVAASAPAPLPRQAEQRAPALMQPASRIQSAPPAQIEQQAEEPLLSPEKGAAIAGAFGSLAQTILAQNSRTLEDVVTEMLQPMLKSWLDDNLPSVVERLVKEEIERVSRGRR